MELANYRRTRTSVEQGESTKRRTELKHQLNNNTSQCMPGVHADVDVPFCYWCVGVF